MTFPTETGEGCARAWEAMPWVLQDSAPPEQNEWLMEHLAHCEACRAEFAQQSKLKMALSLPAEMQLDADAGLRRLLNRIDAPESQNAPVRARAANWTMRALVALAIVQAVGIGALSMKMWPSTDNTPYRTLSQASLPVPAGAIHVVPDAGMKLADWNALLHSMSLQVVGGPNDVGAYTVVPTSLASTPGHTLEQLRATRGIRLAEPVSGTP